MPHIPIYPEVEKFIILKKRTKLEEVESDNKKENSTTQTPKRTCKLGSHQRYTLSVPFETLCNDTPNKANALKKVKDISSFVRKVLFKAQLFVNHFILQHPTKLINDFFDQNFWYTISRVIRASSDETEYPNAKIGCIKNLVYNHVYDQVLTHSQPSSVSVDILALFDPDVASNLTSFLNPLILEVKNRMSTLLLTKESLNKEPFEILPALRYILNKYDDIYKAQAAQTDKADSTKPPLPRCFSLFPNPSLHWRFIKIDAQNLTGIFPEAKQKKQANEPFFDHQQRCFYQAFAFKKLGIQSCEKLLALPEEKGRMFLNGLCTDGYTCRVLFARRMLPSSPEDNIRLELDDFLSEEVNKHFRPCTVDPGRRDHFVSYHGGTDIRRLSSIEYYNMGGSVTRMKKQQKHKQELGIEKIETDIPSPKTASVEQFVLYVVYMLQHMNTLFDFYGFDTSKVRWLNYLSSQQVIEESVSILINGGKKYNKDKGEQKKKKKNRHSSTRAPRERKPITTVTTSKRKTRLVLKGLRHGVSNKIYKQLQARERIGELLLLDINVQNIEDLQQLSQRRSGESQDKP
ncbi:hypothetical protein MFLAVUS_007292 [Mucor flavus]|uniref:Uncharacterized protein n=1 Tax=Mucor flavus TaxID=439312 RepID=A0ABP9Z3W1_9FUNG